MGHDRDELRVTFDEVAELYDRVRPKYPALLFDDLWDIARLPEAARIVEVGTGTGQASVPLAQRGASIACLEPGPNLARIARRNLASYPGADVVTSTFEDWNGEEEAYNLVFAATSWHWVDPSIRYAKAARLLKPEGHLAIVTTSHAFPIGFDPFFTELNEVYESLRHGVERWPWPRPKPDEMPDDSADILASGLWTNVEVRRYLWAAEYTDDDFVNLLSTYSDHRLMDPEKRGILFSEAKRIAAKSPDGLIRKHYLTILHVARAAYRP